MPLSEDALAIVASNLVVADITMHSRTQDTPAWRTKEIRDLFAFYCEELRSGRIAVDPIIAA